MREEPNEGRPLTQQRLTLVVGLVAVALSAVPPQARALATSFTYQGRLGASGGPIAQTSCDFQFGLFDAPTAGSQIGATQSKNTVALTQGVFTVELDFGAGAFAGSDRWLEIAVRCPAGSGSFTVPFTPRQRLTATPYALYGMSAGDLICNGCVGSSDLGASVVGSAQIGDGQVTAAKIASGAVGASQLQNNAVGTAKIADGQVGNADLADGAVTSAKVQDGSLSIADINFGTGNVDLPNSTLTTGNISKEGNSFLHNFGIFNTFLGVDAGNFTMTGSVNTGLGRAALFNNQTGHSNTAAGDGALFSNTTGFSNVAIGNNALGGSTTGNYNAAVGTGALGDNVDGNRGTAVGSNALQYNTGGNDNTALGVSALNQNTTGSFNTAVGGEALRSNTVGSRNTAVGDAALQAITAASYNTGLGSGALFALSVGANNTAVGESAMGSGTTSDSNTALGAAAMYYVAGSDNVAVGVKALYGGASGNHTGNTAVGSLALESPAGAGDDNTGVGFQALEYAIGNNNVGIGYQGGREIEGSNNIAIGNVGAAESDTIRIGSSQTATYIAGISGHTSSGGVPVLIDGDGRLGVTSSSRRYKDDIRDMGDVSAELLRLRPVTFRYTADIDSAGLPQYGLIAEEVAEVSPDLVTRDRDGRPDSVRYHVLIPMLLNELQKQAARLDAVEAALADCRGG